MKLKIKSIDVKEQITKVVRPFGTSAAVWVPKRWRGKEVIVILPKKVRK